MQKKFYITTPIYYVNDKPHIGHAYTNIASDVIARFKRLDGYDVKFLTGTDEHGQKVEKSAQKYSIQTQEYVDKIAQNFINLTKDLNLSNDDFIRTTEERHKNFVQSVWQKLIDNNQIYLGKYSGWYSIRDEAYFLESELVNGNAPSGAPVEWIEESSYFFRLESFQQKLLNFYKDNPGFIHPESRKNEVISFVKSGLKDLSVSRTSFKWGIKVPNDENHVIYVWLDALFNYISALNEDEISFWPANLHVVGKDILRFHAVYWPAFLMAADLSIPKRIFAHGWWTNNGEKISKSLGNVIDPYNIIEKYGLDYFRYYLIREITFGNDGNFSEDSFIEKINSELVNKIGNLIFRTVNLIYKNCEQKIPTSGEFNEKDSKLLNDAYGAIFKIRNYVDEQSLKQILEVIIVLSNNANVFIDEEAPWKLKTTDFKRMCTVLYVISEVIRVIALLLQPFIPHTAESILDYFKIKQRSFDVVSKSHCINPGTVLNKPEIFFKKIEIEKN
jgi:methionyl-tRNA synthetase